MVMISILLTSGKPLKNNLFNLLSKHSKPSLNHGLNRLSISWFYKPQPYEFPNCL